MGMHNAHLIEIVMLTPAKSFQGVQLVLVIAIFY